MDSEDDRLMARAQGDRQAFDILADKYRRQLAAYCRELLGNAEDGKDATEEMLLRAWQKRDTWMPTGSVKAWLFAIARNNCLNRLRGCRLETVSNDAEDPVICRVPDSAPLPGNDFWFQLSDAMRRHLDDKHDRLICKLHYREQYTVGEVAEMIEANSNALKSHIQRRIKPAIKRILAETRPDLHPATASDVYIPEGKGAASA